MALAVADGRRRIDYGDGWGRGEGWDDLRRRWKGSSDREKTLFLLIIGTFLCSCPTFALVGILLELSEGYSLAYALRRLETRNVLVLFGIPSFLMLSTAIAIWWGKRRQA